MTRSPPHRATPVSPALLRSFAPLFFNRHVDDGAVSALSLFGFSDTERETCLDAVDLCGTHGECQAVEIYLYRYEAFVQPCDLVVDGLTLLRIPDQLDEGALTWLTICLSTLATRSQITVVPVLPPTSMPAHSTVLDCISPFCPTFLNCDSDVLDFATVISAFLRLPRLSSPELSTCTDGEVRMGSNWSPASSLAWANTVPAAI